MDLKIGDVVELKSGGPWMTVIQIDSKDPRIVRCQWFQNSQSFSGAFPVEALKVLRDEESSIYLDDQY